MKSRTWLMLGSAIALLLAAGAGRPGAAYAYTRPECIRTFERGPLTVLWHSGSITDELAFSRWLISSEAVITALDAGEGDHWSVGVFDGLSGKELWRKDGLGPLEQVVVPGSVWTIGGLYQVKTERWLKDGRHSSDSTLVEMTDRATYLRGRGITYSLSDFFYYSLSEAGAASARVTLREEKTGAVLLSTVLSPQPGLIRDGRPAVQLNLSKYLDPADTERLLSITWEQLDSGGGTLHNERDPVLFTIRAPLKPAWKEGGGGVIGPTGTVAWEPVEGARWYQLTVPGASDGETVEVIVPGNATQYQFTTPLAPGFHWVNLAAEGGGCRQDWSDALPIVVDDLPWHGILSPGPGTLTERNLTVKLRLADWIHGYRIELFDAKSGQLLQVRNLYRSERGGTVQFETDSLIPGHSYRLRATATVEVPVDQVDEVTFTYQPP
ncbi:MAG TPA: hypothetical protein VK191_05580, partial [Symbiobacteriaceae bacterium]|nr:hypothetical protein [Symbiobacteriaceae bacterium]